MKKESKEKDLSKVVLFPWQESVMLAIKRYSEMKESDEYQGISDFSLNRELGVRITMPRSAGHTFLANYIGAKLPTMMVYKTLNDYHNLSNTFALHPSTETISSYEIFYALHKPGVHIPNPEVLEIRDRIINKQVVVIDEAMSVSDDVKNFLLEVSPCIVIMLGH